MTIDLPKLSPVPRKNKAGKVRKPDLAKQAEIYTAREGNICVYAIEVVGTGETKVGVSRTPYARMEKLRQARKVELRMAYFAEIPRKDGFGVEGEFHAHCKNRGVTVSGEWVSFPRSEITQFLRKAISGRGCVVAHEVGDTGDTHEGGRVSDISGQFGQHRFSVGLPKRGRRG